MSNSFGYKVSLTPSPANVTINLNISGVAVSASIASIPSNLDFSLTPVGDFGQQIEDEILTPLIAIGSGALLDKVKSALNGASVNLVTVGPYETDGFVITPGNLALAVNTTATGTGMLQITDTLTLSAA